MAETARQLPPVEAPVEALVRRDRLIVAGGLAGLVLLAWLWLLSGAGTGMDIRMTSRPALFPGGGDAMDMMAMGAAPWSAATWLLIIGMWWIMMIAMMIPSAAPMILLHARVVRHARKGREDAAPVPSGAFLAGYLAVWLGFSLAAAALQFLAGRVGLFSPPMMWVVNVWLAAGLLVAAGLYQLSPLKRACLEQCRAPAEFLSRMWRPGRLGALRMGVTHGAYCLGCCWGLMALLFVGGVMNVYWIVGLAIVVLIEKLLPRGDRLSLVIGPLLVVAGLWLAVRGL